jgi:hypothetical protein
MTGMVDLASFCGDPEKHLSAPFSLNEHTYASDGCIAVRVPRRPDVPENEKAPNAKAEALPWDFSRVEFGPLPVLETLPNRCTACHGRGYKHECPDCRCECESCGGSGKSTPCVRVGNAVFAFEYIDRMGELPGLEIGKPRLIRGKQKRARVLPFRFKGGEGLLMPMEQA